MQPRSYLDILNPEGRRHYRKHQLGLDPDRFTVFLATGINGANNHMELLPTLVDHADRVQAIIVCGRNLSAYGELVHWRTQHPEFSCFIDSCSVVMHRLMQVSDAIVTRGGTTTCAKALHFRCPIIFNAFGGVMPQERLTVKFFRNSEAAELVQNATQFRGLIERWLAERGSYERLRQNFLRLRYEEDPTILIDELVGLAQDAAGVKISRLATGLPNGCGRRG
jgi:processive 1,2-diacylglycerol beta-glucosyltransferase